MSRNRRPLFRRRQEGPGRQAELVSTDTDFARFPGLRWFNPLGQAPRGARATAKSVTAGGAEPGLSENARPSSALQAATESFQFREVPPVYSAGARQDGVA